MLNFLCIQGNQVEKHNVYKIRNLNYRVLIEKKTTNKRDGKKETNAMYKFKYLLVHISMDGCSLKV